MKNICQEYEEMLFSSVFQMKYFVKSNEEHF